MLKRAEVTYDLHGFYADGGNQWKAEVTIDGNTYAGFARSKRSARRAAANTHKRNTYRPKKGHCWLWLN